MRQHCVEWWATARSWHANCVRSWKSPSARTFACGVVPLGLGGSAGFDSPFYLMKFGHGNSVVLQENITSGVFLEGKDEIDYFERLAARLGKLALNLADSATLVGTIAKEYERE